MEIVSVKKSWDAGYPGVLAGKPAPSTVMVGLDPTIHNRGCRVDPRVEPEDDVGG